MSRSPRIWHHQTMIPITGQQLQVGLNAEAGNEDVDRRARRDAAPP